MHIERALGGIERITREGTLKELATRFEYFPLKLLLQSGNKEVPH